MVGKGKEEMGKRRNRFDSPMSFVCLGRTPPLCMLLTAKIPSVMTAVATCPAQSKESGQKRMKGWTAVCPTAVGAVNKEIRLSGRMEEEERQTNGYVYGGSGYE